MSTQLQIYNRALDAVGARSDVASLIEASRGAEVCNLWFGQVRDLVLRAAPWPSARAFARLAVLKERDDTLAWEADDPEPGYRYAYAAPADMLVPRYMTTYERFSLALYYDGATDAQALMSNSEAVILAYTKRQQTTGLWDAGLDMAITYALAAYIAMPLTGKRGRVDGLVKQANDIILDARLVSANADNVQMDTIPDWIAARGYALSGPATRYYYPFGPMINASEAASVA